MSLGEVPKFEKGQLVKVKYGKGCCIAPGIYSIDLHYSPKLGKYMLTLCGVRGRSGTQVIPTMKNNKRAVAAAWEQAQKDVAGVLPENFPLPARYAHPVVLDRMIRVLREGRAQSIEEALTVVKADLKALNADVQVSQEEYDEVVAIKPSSCAMAVLLTMLRPLKATLRPSSTARSMICCTR